MSVLRRFLFLKKNVGLESPHGRELQQHEDRRVVQRPIREDRGGRTHTWARVRVRGYSWGGTGGAVYYANRQQGILFFPRSPYFDILSNNDHTAYE